MPSEAMVATDIGNSCSVSNGYLRFSAPRSYLAAMTFGNCGYAFPAAMGAKIGAPERPAIAYVGDGAWGMSLNEMLTCVREDISHFSVLLEFYKLHYLIYSSQILTPYLLKTSFPIS